MGPNAPDNVLAPSDTEFEHTHFVAHKDPARRAESVSQWSQAAESCALGKQNDVARRHLHCRKVEEEFDRRQQFNMQISHEASMLRTQWRHMMHPGPVASPAPSSLTARAKAEATTMLMNIDPMYLMTTVRKGEDSRMLCGFLRRQDMRSAMTCVGLNPATCNGEGPKPCDLY